jgi:hypothetical protein
MAKNVTIKEFFRFQACAVKKRSALFWVIAQHILAISP